MRIWILSLLLISVWSCKKEIKSSVSSEKDRASAVQKATEDSLIEKPLQPETFVFVTELCDSKGYFDPKRFSHEELEGTYQLWFQNAGISFSAPTVFSKDDLDEVRHNKDFILAKLDRDFASNKKLLENLKTVPNPYWQNIKKQYDEELRQDYEKKKLQIASYSDPSVLINNTFTGKCGNFTKALNSNDADMIAEWQKLREEMSKSNSNPERIINEFKDHLHSSNWKDYAMIDLITFGWGNCSNDDIQRPLHDEKMNREFEKLFIKIDSECDEP